MLRKRYRNYGYLQHKEKFNLPFIQQVSQKYTLSNVISTALTE